MDHNIFSSTEQKQHSEDCQDLFWFYSLQPATQIWLPLVLLLISPLPDEAVQEHQVKTIIIKRRRLTEIFGGAPGPGLALAQGEAALSAQETPHPCPACGRARSSQPPSTPSLGVDAAKECPPTPSCCSSPELTASKSPAPQINCT